MAAHVKDIAQAQGIWTSAFLGILRLMIYGFYTFAFYVGSRLVQHQRYDARAKQDYNAGLILSVLFSLFMGFIMLASLTPAIQAITRAKTIGTSVFDVLDRKPAIRDNSNALKSFELKDKIRFRGITFRYPTAPP
jgi:ABC-type multidrug transport system fused ATPase/permease subunit